MQRELILSAPATTTTLVGGAKNAGLLAVSILGAGDEKIRSQILQFKNKLAAESRERGKRLQSKLIAEENQADSAT